MLNQLLFPNPDIEGKNLNILRKIALISFRNLHFQSKSKKIISLQPFLPKISIFSSKNFLPLHPSPQTSWPKSINVSCISYRNK